MSDMLHPFFLATVLISFNILFDNRILMIFSFLKPLAYLYNRNDIVNFLLSEQKNKTQFYQFLSDIKKNFTTHLQTANETRGREPLAVV